jgi:hypothetical protein
MISAVGPQSCIEHNLQKTQQAALKALLFFSAYTFSTTAYTASECNATFERLRRLNERAALQEAIKLATVENAIIVLLNSSITFGFLSPRHPARSGLRCVPRAMCKAFGAVSAGRRTIAKRPSRADHMLRIFS